MRPPRRCSNSPERRTSSLPVRTTDEVWRCRPSSQLSPAGTVQDMMPWCRTPHRGQRDPAPSAQRTSIKTKTHPRQLCWWLGIKGQPPHPVRIPHASRTLYLLRTVGGYLFLPTTPFARFPWVKRREEMTPSQPPAQPMVLVRRAEPFSANSGSPRWRYNIDRLELLAIIFDRDGLCPIVRPSAASHIDTTSLRSPLRSRLRPSFMIDEPQDSRALHRTRPNSRKTRSVDASGFT